MTRTAKIVLVLTGLTVLCLAGACAVVSSMGPALPALFGCRTDPQTAPVVTQPDRIRQLFPRLGDFDGAHWQEQELRARTCPDVGPMDYQTAGLIVLAAGTAASYREAYEWQPASAPEIPQDLREYAPSTPAWRTSAPFDRDVAGAGRPSPVFWLDATSGTFYFTLTTD